MKLFVAVEFFKCIYRALSTTCCGNWFLHKFHFAPLDRILITSFNLYFSVKLENKNRRRKFPFYASFLICVLSHYNCPSFPIVHFIILHVTAGNWGVWGKLSWMQQALRTSLGYAPIFSLSVWFVEPLHAIAVSGTTLVGQVDEKGATRAVEYRLSSASRPGEKLTDIIDNHSWRSQYQVL